MSATTRESLAAALSTIDGVQGYKSRPDTLNAAGGDAWPLVGELNRPPEAPAVWQTVWRIAVTLSPDLGVATDQFDTIVPAVCDALVSELYIDSARPLTIPTEAGSLYGIEFLGRSE